MGWNPFKEVKKAVSSVTNTIGNVAESAVKSVGSVANVVVTTVDGGSTSKALGNLGQNLGNTGGAWLDTVTFGQGDKLDAVSGGLYSATKNVYQTPADLFNGNSVRDNLQDAGRLGIVLASGGSGGVATGFAVNSALVNGNGQSDISLKSLARAGSTQVGGVFGNILKQVGYEPKPQQQNSGPSQGGYFSDTPTDIFQGADKTNIIIPIIIIGIVATTVFVIKRKK